MAEVVEGEGEEISFVELLLWLNCFFDFVGFDPSIRIFSYNGPSSVFSEEDDR